MTEDVLVADGLEKRYGDVEALQGVSLSVSAGEVFALVGPNGAGKTTLVRCSTGTTTPSGGSTTVLGARPRDVDRARIGLLPQDFSPPDRLTPRELLTYYAGLYDETQPVGAVLEAVGMVDSAEVRYADLSGGQKRRTLVGTAIVNDPEVLFLDEPTTGIDPVGRRAVWSMIEELAAGGGSVFLTTHSMEEVERLADRIGVLLDGQLVHVGAPGELLAAHGGASRLVVRTGSPDDVGDELAGYAVTRTGDGIYLDDVEPREIGAVVDGLRGAGVEFDALTWRKPDLETIYLDLTGEASDEVGAADTLSVGGDAR